MTPLGRAAIHKKQEATKWKIKKYVAYVGTYTHGSSKGLQVYDVDVEKGTLTERSEVEVRNSSHTALSKNGLFLYSIEDEGVAVFRRDKDGDLERINSVDIDGMRGCFLSTDVDGEISVCGRLPRRKGNCGTYSSGRPLRQSYGRSFSQRSGQRS